MNSTQMNAPPASRRDWTDIAFGVGVIALMPLLLQQGAILSSKPHLQFFILAWGLFAATAYFRGVRSRPISNLRFGLGVMFVVASGIAAVFAVALISPWLSHVSMILLCLGWMFCMLGGNKLHQPIAWSTLLLITLPLPMNLDMLLIQRLQTLSTRSAGSLLDVLTVAHLQRGNVLETRLGDLFVDEACSGVDSLYSLAAIAISISIWHQRSFLVSLILFLSVPLWAWFGNVLRISAIAFCLEQWQFDLSHGLPHTFLGLGVFAVSCSSLIATQSLALHLTNPFVIKPVSSSVLHVFYNFVTGWPGTKKGKKANRIIQSGSTGAIKTTMHPVRSGRGSPFAAVSLISVSCAFVFVGVVSLIQQIGYLKPNLAAALATPAASQVDTVLSGELLNGRTEGLVLVDFKISHREHGSNFGIHSATWRFLDLDRSVTISFDFPFPSFHGLESCYILSGEEMVTPVENRTLAERLSGHEFVVYETYLRDALGESSFLCYSNFSAEGVAVVERSGLLWKRALYNKVEVTTYQTQILVEGVEELSMADRERYSQLLYQISDLVLAKIHELTLQKGSN